MLATLLCTRGSASGLDKEDVDGPGLLSMATSDTVKIHNVGKSTPLFYNLTILTNTLGLKLLP